LATLPKVRVFRKLTLKLTFSVEFGSFPNSFTESQAKSRIETNGFANVSGLAKDSQGVWRGKAMKGGQSVDVSADFQGNVMPR
jgi:hypothetical protein